MLGGEFVHRKEYNNIFSEEQKRIILKEADDAIDGKIKCFFSGWIADFGSPYRWHYNPKRDIEWPSDVSANTVHRYENDCGDIKMPWEPNRFPQLHKAVRAYMLTGDDKYADFF